MNGNTMEVPMGIMTENIVVVYFEAGRGGEAEVCSGVIIERRIICEHLSI